jgi:hypothetical protein
MTAKLYESIKLRLDQLADKGIEYWRWHEDKKEFDYIVNILTRISDVDVSDVLGYLTISRLRKFMLMQRSGSTDKIGSSVELTEAEQNERETRKNSHQADRFPRPLSTSTGRYVDGAITRGTR